MTTSGTAPTLTCKKKKFLDQAYAQLKVKVMRAGGAPGGWKLTEYKCRKCGFWHVGNNRQRDNKRFWVAEA